MKRNMVHRVLNSNCKYIFCSRAEEGTVLGGVVEDFLFFFFFQGEVGIRDWSVTGGQTCALPISRRPGGSRRRRVVRRDRGRVARATRGGRSTAAHRSRGQPAPRARGRGGRTSDSVGDGEQCGDRKSVV